MNLALNTFRPKPAIFSRPGLESIVYAETQKTDLHDPHLSGNVSASGVIIGEENYQRVGTSEPLVEWQEAVRTKSIATLEALRQDMHLDDIGMVRPVHGADLLDMDEHLYDNSYRVPLENRLTSDAAISTKKGAGIATAPADCMVDSTVYVEKALKGIAPIAVAQKHSGFRGTLSEMIPLNIERLEQRGLMARNALVHLSPHARRFQLDEEETEIAYDLIGKAGKKERQLYLRNMVPGIQDRPVIHMTRIATQQLLNAGVHPNNISIDPRDTTTDPRLFSHYNALNLTDPEGRQNTPNGRFAVAIGMRYNRQ